MELPRLPIVFLLLHFVLWPLPAFAFENPLAQRCREAAGFFADGRFSALFPERSAISDCKVAMQSDQNNVDLPAYLGRALYDNKQYKESAVQVTEAARRGSVLGWVLTGVQYEYGYGRDKDSTEALKWYRRASDAGHPTGHQKAAEILIGIASTTEQKAEAVAYLRKALAARASGAEFYLGYVLERGYILPKDLAAAVEAYSRGVALNDPWSMTRLGHLHLKGAGVRRDVREAVALFKRAAALNDPRAQTALANLYLNGEGVEQDTRHAILLYRQAAAADDPVAARWLGFLYRGLLDVPEDLPQAISWLKIAAGNGDADAQTQLGNMYRIGEGVRQNMTEAIRLYKLAAVHPAQAVAQHALGYIYTVGDGVLANRAEAERWFKLAAQSYSVAAMEGQANAQYQLGGLYFGGFGLPENHTIACHWWLKAASQNIAEVYLRLAQCYGPEGGLPLNLAESARQLELAANSHLPRADVLSAIALFMWGSTKLGENTIMPKMSQLVRTVVDELKRDRTLTNETNVDSTFGIAMSAMMSADYPLSVYCLKTLDGEFMSARSAGQNMDVIATRYTLSYILFVIGDGSAARRYFDEAGRLVASLKRNGEITEQATRRLMVGGIYGLNMANELKLESEHPRLAIAHALGPRKNAPEDDLPPEILAAIGKMMRSQESGVREAMSDMFEFMSNAKDSADSPGLHSNLGVATSVYRIRSDLPLEEHIRKVGVLAMRAIAPGVMEDLRLGIYLELARRLEQAGKLSEAVYFGKLAVLSSESMRSHFEPDEQSLQEKFVSARSESYRLTASLLAKAGRFVESEDVLRLLRFDELRQELRQERVGHAVSGGMTSVCVNRECQIYGEQLAINKKYTATLAKLRDLLTAVEPDTNTIDQLVREQERLALEWQRNISSLATNAAAVDEQTIASQLASVERQAKPFANILRELGPGTVAVRYIVRKDMLLIMVSMGGAKTPTLTEVKINETELNELVGALRSAIGEQKSDVEVAARAVYEVILGPVVAQIDAASGMGERTVLMIAPDKALDMVPFAALFDGRTYVVQRWATTIFNDASTANLMTAPGRPKLHGFGVTRAIRKNPELRHVRDELSKISAMVSGAPAALDADFTRDKLYQTFHAYEAVKNQTSIIHIASHFNLQTSVQSGDASSLILGDENVLTLTEIQNWGMGNTELLTLSACNTAVNPASANGEHLNSFAAIAQNNGARAVLGTLWAVNDSSSSLFMERFYRYKFSTGALTVSKARAIQQAQLDFLRPDAAKPAWRHPFYWAGYTLLGNWR